MKELTAIFVKDIGYLFTGLDCEYFSEETFNGMECIASYSGDEVRYFNKQFIISMTWRIK